LDKKYEKMAPKLSHWLEENVPEGLAVLTLPKSHRIRMRTANPNERAVQQEIKRRTSKIRVFPNRESLMRLVTAVLVEIDEIWATADRAYINWKDDDEE
jgi:putative transposase